MAEEQEYLNWSSFKGKMPDYKIPSFILRKVSQEGKSLLNHLQAPKKLLKFETRHLLNHR